MDVCVFCTIARGEMPAAVVWENDEFMAFDDIMPRGPVHTIVIPKRHFAGLSDNVPAETLGGLFAGVAEVAALKGVAETGYRVIVNTGRDAAQTVRHLHVHVLGGAPMSHRMVRFGEERRD